MSKKTNKQKLVDTNSSMVVTRGEVQCENDEQGKVGQIYDNGRRLNPGW